MLAVANLRMWQRAGVPQTESPVLYMQDHPACLSAFYLKEEAGPISLTDELLHQVRQPRDAPCIAFYGGYENCRLGCMTSQHGPQDMLQMLSWQPLIHGSPCCRQM